MVPRPLLKNLKRNAFRVRLRVLLWLLTISLFGATVMLNLFFEQLEVTGHWENRKALEAPVSVLFRRNCLEQKSSSVVSWSFTVRRVWEESSRKRAPKKGAKRAQIGTKKCKQAQTSKNPTYGEGNWFRRAHGC